MNDKLSIKKTLLATFALIVMKWRRFFEVSIIPIVLLTVFSFVPMLLINSASTEPLQLMPMLSLSVMFVFAIYTYIAWAINIHRLTLLTDNATARFGDYLPNHRINRYFMWTLALVGIAIVLIMIYQVFLLMIIAVIPQLHLLLAGVFYLLLAAIFVVLSLRFPAIATDRMEHLISNAVAKKNLIALLFLVVLLPGLVAMPLTLLFGSSDSILLSILMMPVEFITMLWGVITLSLCYRQLSDITNDKGTEYERTEDGT